MKLGVAACELLGRGAGVGFMGSDHCPLRLVLGGGGGRCSGRRAARRSTAGPSRRPSLRRRRRTRTSVDERFRGAAGGAILPFASGPAAASTCGV